MKKYFLYTLLAIACCAGFTSCSDDDPEDLSAVIGTWDGERFDTYYSNLAITFNSDRTGTATIDYSSPFDENGNYDPANPVTIISRAQFTYSVKGNVVTTNGTLVSGPTVNDLTVTETFNNTYEVNGNYLKVTGGSDWYTGAIRSYIRRR